MDLLNKFVSNLVLEEDRSSMSLKHHSGWSYSDESNASKHKTPPKGAFDRKKSSNPKIEFLETIQESVVIIPQTNEPNSQIIQEAGSNESESDCTSSDSDNPKNKTTSTNFSRESIEYLSNKLYGLTYAEKQQLFEYIKSGFQILDTYADLMRKYNNTSSKYSGQSTENRSAYYARLQAKLSKAQLQRREYITNIIMIFNSFFEYGFVSDIQKDKGDKDYNEGFVNEVGQTNDLIDHAIRHVERETGESFEDNPYFNKVTHFWEYLAMKCSSLATVRFVLFHKNSEGKSPNELGIRWVLLAVYKTADLYAAFNQIFCDSEFLLMYSINDSYMWQCRKDIIECLELLKGRVLHSECAILNEFVKYQKQREEGDKALGWQLQNGSTELSQISAAKGESFDFDLGKERQGKDKRRSVKSTVKNQNFFNKKVNGESSRNSRKHNKSKTDSDLDVSDQDIGPKQPTESMKSDRTSDLERISEKGSVVQNYLGHEARVGIINAASDMSASTLPKNRHFISRGHNLNSMESGLHSGSYGDQQSMKYQSSHFNQSSPSDKKSKMQFGSLKTPLLQPSQDSDADFEDIVYKIEDHENIGPKVELQSAEDIIPFESFELYAQDQKSPNFEISKNIEIRSRSPSFEEKDKRERHTTCFKNLIKTVRLKMISQENEEIEFICEINNVHANQSELIKSVYRINDTNDLFYVNDDNEFKLELQAFTYECSLSPNDNSLDFDPKQLLFDFYIKQDLILTVAKKEQWKNQMKRKWFDKCRELRMPFKSLNSSKRCTQCLSEFKRPTWQEILFMPPQLTKCRIWCFFCSEFHCRDCMVQDTEDLNNLTRQLSRYSQTRVKLDKIMGSAFMDSEPNAEVLEQQQYFFSCKASMQFVSKFKYFQRLTQRSYVDSRDISKIQDSF